MKTAKKWYSLASILTVLAVLAGGVGTSTAQAPNLLYNGGFEGTYVTVGPYEAADIPAFVKRRAS